MAEKRDTLTKLLLDLMEKKQARAEDLQKIMREMEGQKEKEHENYWLIQYQKLLDSKPKGLAAAEDKLDPKVRHNFKNFSFFLEINLKYVWMSGDWILKIPPKISSSLPPKFADL